jgi:hypothetical protein
MKYFSWFVSRNLCIVGELGGGNCYPHKANGFRAETNGLLGCPRLFFAFEH